jgi:hypothetical protein
MSNFQTMGYARPSLTRGYSNLTLNQGQRTGFLNLDTTLFTDPEININNL